MSSNWHEGDIKVVLVSNPELIHSDGHRIIAASGAVSPVRNAPNLSQTLESELEKVVAPARRAKVEDNCDDLADRPVSKEYQASRILLAQSYLSARL